MEIKIRKFEEKDIAQAVELCDEIREYHRAILHGYFNPIDRHYEEQALLSTLGSDKSFAIVAMHGEKLVGLLIADKKCAPYLEKPSVCHIGTLGVTKDYRQQGIGRMMMKEFLEFCKQQKIQEVSLGVFNDNKSAYKFYEDYGFKPQEQKMTLKFD